MPGDTGNQCEEFDIVGVELYVRNGPFAPCFWEKTRAIKFDTEKEYRRACKLLCTGLERFAEIPVLNSLA